MPHIELVKNNGQPYLRLAESRYVKDLKKQKKFVLKNLGPLSKYDDGKPGFLKRLREQFKNGEIDFDGITYSNKCAPKKTFEIDGDNNYIDLKNFGYLFLESLYNELGISDVLRRAKSESKIEYDLNGITKLLVMDRILHPSSKKRAFEQRNDYLFPITTCEDINQVYKALDVLDQKSKAIQTRMNSKIKQSSIGRQEDLLFYDVTNYFFETMYGDDDEYEVDEEGNVLKDEKGKPIVKEPGLRKKGVSKENRKEPIVQMGLFIDNQGIPVSYKVFPGNTQDKTTFKNVLQTDIKDMNLGRIIAVADNGMNSQENKYLLVDDGNGYIVSKSVKKSWTKLGPWALDESGYTVTTDKTGQITFKYKSRINEIKLTFKNADGTKSTKTIKEKEIMYWSKKHYDREVMQNQKFIEYLESCREHPDKLKDKQKKSQEFIDVLDVNPETGEIIKTDKLVVLLDEKIEKYKETMGFYCIVTSEADMEDREVINKYHGLSRIEDSFRIIKSDLNGRPIFVWTKEHINAHFLICFIALTIIRILQYRVLAKDNKNTLTVDGWEEGITAENIKKALAYLKAASDKNGVCLVTTPCSEVEEIIGSLKLEVPDLTSIDKINQFKYLLRRTVFM